MAVLFEPFSSKWRSDPYPVYRELRDRAPVHWAPQAGVYCVSRYDDVMQVLRSPESFSSWAMFTMLMNNGDEGDRHSRGRPSASSSATPGIRA